MIIEAARMLDGTAPADVFLEDLFNHEEYEMLSDSLGSDIWEIKAVKVRLPFYYVDSHAGYRTIRITNGFIKKGQRCPPKHIRTAMRVRGEDLTT